MEGQPPPSPLVADPANVIRAVRSSRLNFLLGRDGPDSPASTTCAGYVAQPLDRDGLEVGMVGPVSPGYMAQSDPAEGGPVYVDDRQRGGRGGGGVFGRNPPPRHPFVPKTTPKQTLPPAGAVSGEAKVADAVASSFAALPEVAVAVVKALAAVTIPASTSSDGRDVQSDKGSDKAETVRANKAAHKKEKMSYYWCGELGHFVIDCTAVLCDMLHMSQTWSLIRQLSVDCGP